MLQINDIKFAIETLQKKNLTSNNIGGKNYNEILAEELESTETFEGMWQSTLESYFGNFSQNYYHVMDASNIPKGYWTHNDFPYGKFLTNQVDESVLTWQPTRANPSQLDPTVQKNIHATLGKNSIVVPPELDEKMKTDPDLRKKVLANIDKVCKFHTQPVQFKMPGVKEYGTKMHGSVIILNADGEVDNCCFTGGGTFLGPDEETLRQIEHEQKMKLRRKIYNRELIQESLENYLLNKNYFGL